MIGARVQFVAHMRSRFGPHKWEKTAVGTVYGMVNWSNGNPADPKQRRYALVKWDHPAPSMWADTAPVQFMRIATRCLEEAISTRPGAINYVWMDDYPPPLDPRQYYGGGRRSGRTQADLYAMGAEAMRRQYDRDAAVMRSGYNGPPFETWRGYPLYGRSPGLDALHCNRPPAGSLFTDGLVTVERLKAMNACTMARLKFDELFPRGIRPTMGICIRFAQEFDFAWAAKNLLTNRGFAMWHQEVKPAWDRYYHQVRCQYVAEQEYKHESAVAFYHAWKGDH